MCSCLFAGGHEIEEEKNALSIAFFDDNGSFLKTFRKRELSLMTMCHFRKLSEISLFNDDGSFLKIFGDCSLW